MVSSTPHRAPLKKAGAWICASCRQQRYTALHRPFAGPAAERSRSSKQTIIKNISETVATRSRSNAPSFEIRRAHKIPDLPARTRFAPSPTGYTHIGGLRTALFSYLLAKRTNGQFLLRIEDTDQKRLVPDAEQRLCEDLQWAGLQWDEGPLVGGDYGPYKQSERTAIYQEHAGTLLAAGSAYRCFCTPQSANASESRAAYVTSGCYQSCSSLSSDESQDRAETKKQPFTVRLRQPTDVHKRIYTDLVYGKIQRLKRSPSASPSSSEGDVGLDAADTILVKSDGTPTYHFANVVDDHLMGITHVIRGSEWMASTPLHYDLYTAFGWQPPQFAHVGLLVDQNKAKLSKRSDAGLILDVRRMREEQGVLPKTLVNFLALLGWSNPQRNDVMEMEQLRQIFDLKFTKGNTIVNMEKLWYLQKQHAARNAGDARGSGSMEPLRDMVGAVRTAAAQSFPDHALKPEYCAQILVADAKSYTTPAEYVHRNRYFFAYDPASVPVESESHHDKEIITADDLQKITAAVLTDPDSWEPHSEARPPLSSTAGPKPDAAKLNMFQRTEASSKAIHSAIDEHIWRHVYSKHADATISFGEWRDQENQARQAGEKAMASKPREREEMHVLNKAMMRYLREKLSYGLPGPGVGMIMAILGWEECCRRLGVKPVNKEEAK